ncbi:MAG TPA: hypothetical protein VJ302_37535 [Blastocatellia bacterium]|nr:hypothetical protein [Blastocatellia bacterium]
MHRAIGITDLPPNATPEQERNFALMWIGIILFVMMWTVLVFVFLYYMF